MGADYIMGIMGIPNIIGNHSKNYWKSFQIKNFKGIFNGVKHNKIQITDWDWNTLQVVCSSHVFLCIIRFF